MDFFEVQNMAQFGGLPNLFYALYSLSTTTLIIDNLAWPLTIFVYLLYYKKRLGSTFKRQRYRYDDIEWLPLVGPIIHLVSLREPTFNLAFSPNKSDCLINS